MAKPANKGVFRAGAYGFDYGWARALEMVWSDRAPGWFREHFNHGEHIQEQFSLSPKGALAVALALDLALGGDQEASSKRRASLDRKRESRTERRRRADFPTEPPLKDIRRTLDRTKASLEMAREHLLELRDARLKALTPNCLELDHHPDGAIALHMEPDPIHNGVQNIEQLLLRLGAVDIPRDQGGRRISPWHCAVRRLVELIERDNPGLTRAQRDQLCHH